MNDTFTCDVCSGRVLGEKYGDGVCETCGQKYEYNEGNFIVLTEKQKAMLKFFNQCEYVKFSPGTQIRQSEQV